MKKRVKRLITFLLVMICVLTQKTAWIQAETLQSNNNMDVVLVIDVSGSMGSKKSTKVGADPNRIVLEGAKLFIDMMESSGSRAGLVAFSDVLNQVYNLTPLNTGEDKEAIKSIIAGLEYTGDTDIGLAVQKAVEMITTAQDVGNNKMILFFTDGKIDLPKGTPSEAEAEKQSREYAEGAIEAATKAGIPIYTIGLNVNGSVDTDLISKMSANTGAKNNIVTQAEELPSIFNSIFADFVETEINEVGDITISNADTYEELPFDIPNDSVLEANIVMITSGSGSLNDILLVEPDGTTVAPDGKRVILTTSKNYNMLKIIGPMAGTWTLRVKGDQGCQVHVNLLFNYDVILKADYQPDEDGNLEVTASLEKNGALVSDEALYGQLTTVANVTREDGTITSYPMQLSGTTFTCTVPVAAGETVQVVAHTEGANMYRDSNAFSYSNSAVAVPQLTQTGVLPSPIILKGLLPGMAKAKLDLNDYFGSTDPSGNTNSFDIQVFDEDIVTAEINGNELLLKGAAKGTTQIDVKAMDAEGNSLYQQADVIVKTFLGHIWQLIVLLLIVVLVIIIVLVVIFNFVATPSLKGTLNWWMEDEYNTRVSDEEEYFLEVSKKKKITVDEFVMDLALNYSQLNKIEISGTKNGVVVKNKGNGCVLLNEIGANAKKLNIMDQQSFRIACKTEDGEDIFVYIQYLRNGNMYN